MRKKCGVKVGAPVVPLSPFEYDQKRGIMQGKAFDDRLGVAALLIAVKKLKKERLNVDITGVISSQEEVGDRGIRAAMHRVRADAALRGGVMLRYMDRTVICTPRFTEFSRGVAAKHNIKVQMAVRSGGGNNGAYIISANGGTPVIVAGIPVRYIHTFSGIAAMDDFQSVVNLSVELCKSLNGDIIKGF